MENYKQLRTQQKELEKLLYEPFIREDAALIAEIAKRYATIREQIRLLVPIEIKEKDETTPVEG